ncbi:MAG: Yip1 family protein [Actinomycetota bacterium]
MNAAVEPEVALQRESWRRAFAIFRNPRRAFDVLRDDSDEAAEARQEPVLALILLAGFAGVLSTALAGRSLDDPVFGGSLFAVLAWGFLGGALYGIFVYWLGGLMVHAFTRGLGGTSSYRQARHVVAFAAAPLGLSLLLVWPVRLAIYGSDVFRSGGSDAGLGDKLFEALVVAAFAWTIVLVVIGARTVSGVSWPARR